MSFYISAIIPSFNRYEFLANAVKSVKNQSIENYEIIVVDDNSTDDTSLYIESLQTKNKNIRIIVRKDKNSLPKSIYEGILYSSKSYVMWLDADGSMLPIAMNNLIKHQILEV